MGTDHKSGADTASYGRQLKLSAQGALPPTSAYIGVDNQIWFFVSCSQAGVLLSAVARILLPDGTVSVNQWSFTVNNSRVPSGQGWSLPEGFLLSLVVYSSNNSNVRPLFVSCQIIQSGQNPPIFASMLCMGYTSLYQPISWPTGVNTTSVDCAGNIRSITGTTPGAGAEISETVPSGAKWQLLAIRFLFTTSAAVANRFVSLTADDGLNVFTQSVATGGQTAGLSVLHNFAAGFTGITGSVSPLMIQLPFPLFLSQGFRVRTSTSSIQAADQYSAVQYLVQEWLLP